MTKKHKCSKCGKMATWYYLPSTRGRSFFCDDCVPRGCTCNIDNIEEMPSIFNMENVRWWPKHILEKCLVEKGDPMLCCTNERQADSFYYEVLDELNRREPCVEFEYSESGFEFESNFYVVGRADVLEVFAKVIYHHPQVTQKMIGKMDEVIMSYRDIHIIPYNEFMTKISECCRPYIIRTMLESDKINLRCYNSFRSQLYEKKFNILSEE